LYKAWQRKGQRYLGGEKVEREKKAYQSLEKGTYIYEKGRDGDVFYKLKGVLKIVKSKLF